MLAIASIGLSGATNVPFPAEGTFTIALSGAAESNIAHPSGGTGDPNGSGTIKLVITPGDRQVCYDLRLSHVAEPLMAHILRGPTLKNGAPIVALFTGPGAPLNGCASANSGQLAEMIADPLDFYVSVATTDFPDGALRGQL